MIEIDGKIYRNLEEQVKKNKDDIELLQGQSPDTSGLEQRIETIETQVTNLIPQVDASLKKLEQSPQNIELVSINTNNNQQMIGIGDGLIIEDSILKLTGEQQQEINIDNVSITRNTFEEIQAVALKDRLIKATTTTINKNDFKGVIELENREQYNQLKDNGSIVINGETITYDENQIYVIPTGGIESRLNIAEENIIAIDDRVSDIEGTVINLSQDVSMALKVPGSTLPATELVGVDNTKSQVMIELGQGLTLQNNVLSAGNGGTDVWTGSLKSSSSSNTITLSSAINYNDEYELEYYLNGTIHKNKYRMHEENGVLGTTQLINLSSNSVTSSGFRLYATTLTFNITQSTVILTSSSVGYFTATDNSYTTNTDNTFELLKITKI